MADTNNNNNEAEKAIPPPKLKSIQYLPSIYFEYSNECMIRHRLIDIKFESIVYSVVSH